jgi:hypothetical protein
MGGSFGVAAFVAASIVTKNEQAKRVVGYCGGSVLD